MDLYTAFTLIITAGVISAVVAWYIRHVIIDLERNIFMLTNELERERDAKDAIQFSVSKARKALDAGL
jgi:hypothetical protein